MVPHPNHQNLKHSHKPLGAYLVEAGLLSDAQVGVALADQGVTSMSFGEIVVTRGWVKEKTIEYLMKKVVIPERVTQKRSFADLESSLIRQQPKATLTSRGASDPLQNNNGQSLSGRAVSSGITPPEEGVDWIG